MLIYILIGYSSSTLSNHWHAEGFTLANAIGAVCAAAFFCTRVYIYIRRRRGQAHVRAFGLPEPKKRIFDLFSKKNAKGKFPVRLVDCKKVTETFQQLQGLKPGTKPSHTFRKMLPGYGIFPHRLEFLAGSHSMFLEGNQFRIEKIWGGGLNQNVDLQLFSSTSHLAGKLEVTPLMHTSLLSMFCRFL